jgi:hypothetical protein
LAEWRLMRLDSLRASVSAQMRTCFGHPRTGLRKTNGGGSEQNMDREPSRSAAGASSRGNVHASAVVLGGLYLRGLSFVDQIYRADGPYPGPEQVGPTKKPIYHATCFRAWSRCNLVWLGFWPSILPVLDNSGRTKANGPGSNPGTCTLHPPEEGVEARAHR